MKKLGAHSVLARMVLISLFGTAGERGANPLLSSPAIPDHCRFKRGRRKRSGDQRLLRHTGHILSLPG